ncbi:MAG: inositol monophosphatase [Nitriliruptor sp.]|nr:MAG: inositol monophosphatase [Nitriliruptor sp.]
MPVLRPAVAAEVATARDVAVKALDDLHELLLDASGEVDATEKTDGTPVTATDHTVDERLASAIGRALPGHGILSEERNTVAPDTEWTWIIDPIDGTSNFIAGLPWWCVSVALAFQGVPVLGVIDAPALGRRYIGIQGEGANRQGRPLRVRPTVDWRSPRYRHLPVMLTTGTARRARAAGLRLNPRVMGSTALDLAIVAEGVAVASVAVAPHVWDVAAGMVLVQEAGGEVVTPGGDPWLPIEPGTDHQKVATTTAAAADGDDAARLVEALLAQT